MFGALCLSLFVALAAASAPSQHHKSFASQLKATNKRLSGEVTPNSYTLSFRLDEDFAEKNSFTGTATIAVTVGEVTTEDSPFQFHAKDLTFTSSVLTDKNGEIAATFSEPDLETDFVTVTPKTKLEPGDYTLVFEYSGVLSDTAMVGFYKSSYIDQFKKKKYVAATQFEETHARRAFPCFDEPAMKATFSLSLTYPKGYYAWANTVSGTPKPDKDNPNLETVKFGKTAKMSTYLVAFLVAEFNCKQGDAFNKKPVEVCSEITAMDTSAIIALDAAPKLLEKLSYFTNFNYSMSKLTLAAIPDFAPGAMENWGLITFRESGLLWYENESSNYDKQMVVTNIAHELSHQWFGDYVTLSWWSDMFLNEGFATYFAYIAAQQIYSYWDLPLQFVVEKLHSALEADSWDDALPLSYDTDNADFSSRTNDVSYNKGASIIRMIHNFLGLDLFQKGIRDYIAKNGLSTVTPESLWEAFQPYVAELPVDQQPPEDLTVIMENWTKKPGYPVVTAIANGNDVEIIQYKFSMSEDGNSETDWYIPITYATSAIEALNISTHAWLAPGSSLTIKGVLKDDGILVLNNGQVGYYRVDYSEVLLTKIYNTLQEDLRNINEISRAALIDDQINLAKAGIKTYQDTIYFLRFLKNENSYYSWYAAFNGFNYLLRHTVDERVYAFFVDYIQEQMTEVLKTTSFDEEIPNNHLKTLRQVLVATWACKLGNADCIASSVAKFEEYKSTKTRPGPNLRSVVYCTGLRNSKDASADFDFLWNQYKETRIFSEKITLLKALGCVPSDPKREEYLKMAITEESIRRQDARYVFSSVYSESPEGVISTLNFIVNNHEDITKHFGETNTLSSLIREVADFIFTQDQIDLLTTFSHILGLDSSVKDAAIKATEIGARNLKEITRIENEFTRVKTTTESGSTNEPKTTTDDSTISTTPSHPNGAVIIRGDYLAFALVGWVLSVILI